VTANALAKPFLKWAGGKRQLVDELRKYVPEQYNTYFEPFIGGGALLLELQPTSAVIGDSNAELINCYEIVRDSVNELIEELKKHKSLNGEKYYYELRNWDRHPNYKSISAIQRAARIIYLNKTCFNGLYRVNSQGQFNVPYGKYKNPNIVDSTCLQAISQYLNGINIQIKNCDFETTIGDTNKDDFIYLDPPYDPVSATASFTGYSANGFNKNEQRRLKFVVDKLTAQGCKVLLSNACTEFIQELYQDYTQVKVTAARAINSNPEKRGRINEVLVMNYDCRSLNDGTPLTSHKI